MKQYKYLIVGGGMTADAAVKGIRQKDASGPIGIIGAEPHPPYKRPPLSKGLWTKKKTIDDIWCGTEEKGADLVGGTCAVSLDVGKKEVGDERGAVYRYEKLLLAVGGSPRVLPFGSEHAIYYRNLEDYRRLHELSEARDAFAVLGGGFIGSEIAAALAMNDRSVTMIFPEAAVGTRMLPSGLARAMSNYYEQHGVTIVPGRKPSSIDADGDGYAVRLESGHVLAVDAVVAGIGITPNTELAAAAGLDVNNGIVVDELLRTRHPDVYAAGDVANFYNPSLGRRMRVEHEDNALTMGAMAGRNMAGESEPYRHLPYFYSDLFDVGYEAVGETVPSHEVITDIQAPTDKGIIFYVQDERVRGVLFWNIFGKVSNGRDLIAAPGPHNKESLKAWAKETLAEGGQA